LGDAWAAGSAAFGLLIFLWSAALVNSVIGVAQGTLFAMPAPAQKPAT
jgi:hypothetical protein